MIPDGYMGDAQQLYDVVRACRLTKKKSPSASVKKDQKGLQYSLSKIGRSLVLVHPETCMTRSRKQKFCLFENIMG